WSESWSNNQLVENILGEEQLWQKDLWQYLKQELDTYHRVEVWSQLKNVLNAPTLGENIKLPQKVNLFSITSLAPLYLDLIDLLSNHIPVHLFILSPCQENWTDYQLAHPLLDSLGHQGRDFFRILLNYPALLEQDLYSQNTSKTNAINLLQQIQNDILTLNPPSDISYLFNNYQDLNHDTSLTIQSAHSPVRELQILKNYLIHYLEKHPELKLEDIAVLSPNIEHYLPYIDGIFGLYAQDNITFAYSVSDVRVKNDQPYYTAIEAILEFIDSRFEVDSVLELLKNKSIRDYFDISTTELGMIHFTLEKLNISWGLNQKHRQAYQANNNQFTWEKGIKNLKNMLNENSHEYSLLNFKDFCLAFNPNQDEIANTQFQFKTLIQDKLLPFIDVLIIIYEKSHHQILPMAHWIDEIKDISLALIKINSDNENSQKTFFNQLIQLNKAIELAHFNNKIHYSTFKYIIQSSINTISNAGFLNKGITFASLMPMRTIPFKFVALIGMNDQSFPRRNIHSSFDLIQKNRQAGDLSRREDDRYLFLETLISTQQALYMSYIGRSIDRDEALNPSPLINELIELVANMTDIDSKTLQENWITQHPLQNFSKKYFESPTRFINYQTNYLNAYQTENKPLQKFLADYSAKSASIAYLELAELLTFWRNPLRYWLKNELSIDKPWLKSESLFNEPFSLLKIPYANRYKTKSTQLNDKGQFIIQSLLNAIIKQQDITKLKQEFYDLDYLPSGELANTWYASIESQSNDFLNTILPNQNQTIREVLHRPKKMLNIELNINDVTLVAQLETLFKENLILFNYGNTLKDSVVTQAYLKHLIYATQGYQTDSYLLGLYQFIHFKPMDKNLAEAYLKKWIGYMQIGIKTPLPFFYQTSFEVANALNAKNNTMLEDDVFAMQNKFEQSNELSYFENNLLFKDQDMIANNELFLPLIKELLIPMLEQFDKYEI
ncbi:MAG: exodeoxyribonuclease V subunit gamma, partial [Neisseriaceae bacterium]|nr:exodeoxyribonuclease V subunit gamma [Neisseriaceae bacterium]